MDLPCEPCRCLWRFCFPGEAPPWSSLPGIELPPLTWRSPALSAMQAAAEGQHGEEPNKLLRYALGLKEKEEQQQQRQGEEKVRAWSVCCSGQGGEDDVHTSRL